MEGREGLTGARGEKGSGVVRRQPSGGRGAGGLGERDGGDCAARRTRPPVTSSVASTVEDAAVGDELRRGAWMTEDAAAGDELRRGADGGGCGRRR
uniref:Uncharacterized protein n=1 Tax=Oryza sativa subsp. japonica TaxID=39947 RepID=Q67UA1_ORYSJ|nr:hypothetical protein [Oryza sativa Japonica Group]